MKNITNFDNFLNEGEEEMYGKNFTETLDKAMQLEDWFTKWGIKDPEKALIELNEMGFKITYKRKSLFQK